MHATSGYRAIAAGVALIAAGCDTAPSSGADSSRAGKGPSDIERRMATYTTVQLAADTAPLTPKERQMLPLLIEAGQAMDPIYWQQTWGSRDSQLARVTDPATRRYIDVNYGPYDRLDNNAAFIPEIGTRPPGANLYPQDITKEEFEAVVAKGPAARADSLKSLYTLVRRNPDRTLYAVPYHVAFKQHNEIASAKLRQAAARSSR